MGRSTSSQTPNASDSPPAPPLWKDLSVLGCIVSGIVLGLVVLALFSPETGIPKVREVQQIKAQLEADIDQLQTQNVQIQREIEAMRTDPFWQEKIAREELNMALPGEIIYKFPE
jgi:cell division protein FtsB